MLTCAAYLSHNLRHIKDEITSNENYCTSPTCNNLSEIAAVQ